MSNDPHLPTFFNPRHRADRRAAAQSRSAVHRAGDPRHHRRDDRLHLLAQTSDRPAGRGARAIRQIRSRPHRRPGRLHTAQGARDHSRPCAAARPGSTSSAAARAGRPEQGGLAALSRTPGAHSGRPRAAHGASGRIPTQLQAPVARPNGSARLITTSLAGVGDRSIRRDWPQPGSPSSAARARGTAISIGRIKKRPSWRSAIREAWSRTRCKAAGRRRSAATRSKPEPLFRR